ncbi:hypothetical protein [Lentzea sp. NPDC003310]|uniref:hypothetical protein n=1 Tax=Lentzea sp. NPDC003310 TaxID=3154447 RepID=UPI0033B0CC10
MDVEVFVVPDDEEIGSRLGEAAAWPGFAAELTEVLNICIAAAGVDSLEIDALSVNGPLPEDVAWWRNGVRVPADRAAELFVEMLRRSEEVSFRLVGGDVLRIEQSWDSWVFVPAIQAVWDAVEERLDDLPEEHLTIKWRGGQPDIMGREELFDVVADEEFWSAVRAATVSGTTLLGERWAFGVGGIRWHLLSPDTVDDVIAGVEPGSLVSVAANPDLRIRLLEHTFTAFSAPLRTGALVHREVWGGVEDDAQIAEVTSTGFDLFLADDEVELNAVVPHADGAVTWWWEDPRVTRPD